MNDMKQYLQQVLESEIPLTNAFGGSLYSIAVLTGWGLIYTRLKTSGLQAHIVIQKSNIHYLSPVALDIKAMCSIDSEEIFNNFLLIFKKKSIARIKLKVEIPGNNEPDVIFTGQYVIHR